MFLELQHTKRNQQNEQKQTRKGNLLQENLPFITADPKSQKLWDTIIMDTYEKPKIGRNKNDEATNIFLTKIRKRYLHNFEFTKIRNNIRNYSRTSKNNFLHFKKNNAMRDLNFTNLLPYPLITRKFAQLSKDEKINDKF